MNGEQTPREFAFDLAVAGRSAWRIQKELEKRGWAGKVNALQMEKIMDEAGMMRSFQPARHGVFWPRVLGSLALTMGVGAMLLNHGFFSEGESRRSFLEAVVEGFMNAFYRWSPDRYGTMAIILGLILLIKPRWASEPMDFVSWRFWR